jgi:hypothetical protein
MAPMRSDNEANSLRRDIEADIGPVMEMVEG